MKEMNKQPPESKFANIYVSLGLQIPFLGSLKTDFHLKVSYT